MIQKDVVTFAKNLYEYSISKVIPQIDLVRLILQHETWGKLVQIFTKQTNVNLPGSAATVDVLKNVQKVRLNQVIQALEICYGS